MPSTACSLPRLIPLALLALIVISARGVGASPTNQTPTPQPTPAKPILLTDPVPDPQQEGVRWFSATGHTLRGEFLDYWTRYGGLEQFGYPLTEEFFEPVGADNKQYRVQYFERNRFEHHPENEGTQYEVLLGVLGRDFRRQDPPAQPLPAPAVYFRETGHNLSGEFKEYWDTHGGLFVHGFPITEPQMERSTDGKEYLVQWFERSRFEWHPENAGSQYEAQLGLLGRQLSEKKGYPYGWYPLFGRSPDLSWIAGSLIHNSTCFLCDCVPCGCVTLSYDNQRNSTVQLLDPEIMLRGRSYPYELPNEFEYNPDYQTVRLVLFGRITEADGDFSRCRVYPDARGYLVERVQKNPAN